MILFFLILVISALIDLGYRYIPGAFLVIAAVSGAAFSVYAGRNLRDIFASAAVGAFLLLLCRITGGAVGEGDGWFFVVSGLFMNVRENLLLFVSGIFLCGIAGLFAVLFAFVKGKNASRIRIPFLPFLLPGGAWLVFFSG